MDLVEHSEWAATSRGNWATAPAQAQRFQLALAWDSASLGMGIAKKQVTN